MLEAYNSAQIRKITAYFEKVGYQVVKLDKNKVAVPVVLGSAQKCSDDRFEDGDPDLSSFKYSPGFFGGTEGYVALKGGNVRDAYRWATDNIRLIGFEPGNHVAEPHGIPETVPQRLRGIYGCAFIGGWIQGAFPFIPVTAEEIAELRELNDVKIATLKRKHQGDTLVLGFDPDMTVIGNRKFYVVDVLPLARLQIPTETWVPVVADVGKLVLPKNQPPRLGILR